MDKLINHQGPAAPLKYWSYPPDPVDSNKWPPKEQEDLPDVIRWVDVIGGDTNWCKLDREGLIKFLDEWKYSIHLTNT